MCEFLEKEIPQEDFPSGNTPADFEKRMDEMMKQRMVNAALNLVLAISAVAVLSVGLWYGQRALWPLMCEGSSCVYNPPSIRVGKTGRNVS